MLKFVFIKTAFAQTSSSVLNIWRNTSGGGCNIAGPCTFCDGLIVIRNIITFLLELSIPIGVAMLVWSALSLAIAGGNEQKISSAKKGITASIWGIALALSAWIIVNTLLKLLSGNIGFPWTEIKCQ